MPLSTEQQSQLAAIFQQLDVDLQNLLAGAEGQIQALLTTDQQTQFAAQGLQPKPADPPTASKDSGAAPATETPPPHDATGAAGSIGAAPGGGGPGPLGALGQDSGLTDEQRTAIDEIMSSLRMATRALHDQAQTDLKTILTPEQAALLDQQGDPPSNDQSGASQPGQASTANNTLQLTSEQQAQADEIFAQLKADMDLLRVAAEQQVLALLTDDQKSQLTAADSTTNASAGDAPLGQMPPPPKEAATEGGVDSSTAPNAPPPGDVQPKPEGGAGGPMLEQLTAQLDLTAEQSAGVSSILDSLRAAIQTRVQQAVTDMRAIAAGNSTAAVASSALSTASQ